MNALAHTDHRPWPLPTGPWIMAQRWLDLLFAHWPIPVETMRALVPPQLELDTFDNQAWIGVVPFRMSNVRPRSIPSMPWLSAFPELNLRTYVKAKSGPHKPGVWFFSLEAANPVAVALARSLFKLPYFNAQMRLHDSGSRIDYFSQRTHKNAPPADFVGGYAPTGPIDYAQPNTIDAWLTERYCLYTVHKQQVYRGEIHHQPWPLQPAEAEFNVNTIAAASNITLPQTKTQAEPLLHFARQLDVVVWPLREVT